jgi:DNA polymerase III delta subunit
VKVEEALKSVPSATVYLSFGAGLFSKNQFRKKLERTHDGLPRVVVFGDDEEILDKAECGGLIPEPRLVIIESFSEVKNKKALFELIDRSAEGSVYLLQSEKKEKVQVSREIVEVECPAVKINEREFVSIVKTWVKGSPVQINDSIIKRIFSVTGGDLFYAQSEVKKILLYAEATNSAHLSLHEINSIMGPRIETDPFSFSTLFLQKNAKGALREVAQWRQYDTMLHTYNHFKALERAVLAKTCKDQGMAVEKISAETGIPAWYFRFVFPDIDSKWTTSDLIGALKDCAHAIEKSKKIANMAIPVIVESVLRRIRFGGSVE